VLDKVSKHQPGLVTGGPQVGLECSGPAQPVNKLHTIMPQAVRNHALRVQL
jgi:hypothetical protein